jgi:hypothetical protein
MAFTIEKSGPKICATSAIFKNLPTVINDTLGENSPNTVTLMARLGIFSPIGKLFSLGIFLRITEAAHGNSYVIILPTMMWTPFWASFSSNSSGHHARGFVL